jgi:hypothetical protein
MLAKRRCPYTGIVNYYCDLEPFMAVGSITETAQSRGCVWRSYIGEEAAGMSANMASAERRLAGLLLSAIGNPAKGPAGRRTQDRVSTGIAVR